MIDVHHLCPQCMKYWKETRQPCPHCGFSWDHFRPGNELSPFSILAGRYLLGTLIGHGGFGLTYIAADMPKETVVAVKEFFPQRYARRDGQDVCPVPGTAPVDFNNEIQKFRRESGILSQFSGIDGIVAFRDFIEDNHTAYLVTEYVPGLTLREYMRRTGQLFTQQETVALMQPVLMAVQAMHRAHVIHRDISPDNLILGPDRRLTLIDFGAARSYDFNEQENMTVILKHGYAPEEQYRPDSRQGPWGDVYACCAVMYQMVSGIVPQASASRSVSDLLTPLGDIAGICVSEAFSRSIARGMSVQADQRFCGIDELLKELTQTGQPDADDALKAGGCAGSDTAVGPNTTDQFLTVRMAGVADAAETADQINSKEVQANNKEEQANNKEAPLPFSRPASKYDTVEDGRMPSGAAPNAGDVQYRGMAQAAGTAADATAVQIAGLAPDKSEMQTAAGNKAAKKRIGVIFAGITGGVLLMAVLAVVLLVVKPFGSMGGMDGTWPSVYGDVSSDGTVWVLEKYDQYEYEQGDDGQWDWSAWMLQSFEREYSMDGLQVTSSYTTFGSGEGSTNTGVQRYGTE